MNAFHLHTQKPKYVYICFYYSRKRSICDMLRPSAVYGSRKKGLSTLILKDRCCVPHYSQTCWKLKKIEEMSKSEPAEEVHRSFQPEGGNNHFQRLPESNKIREESSCRFRDSLLCKAKFLGELVQIFQYGIRRLQQEQRQYYAQRVAISQSCMDNVSSDSGFHIRPFFDKRVFHASGLHTLRPRVFGSGKSKETFSPYFYTPKFNNLVCHTSQWCGTSISV